MYLKEKNKLRELQHLNKFKETIKLEKCLTALQQFDAIVIFKLRTWMTSRGKKNRGKYQEKNCSKCLHEPQSLTKYFRQALVFIWNSALRENIYFSGNFC